MARFTDALKLWETSVRLFTAASGVAPEGDAKRLAFIKLLPPAVAAHVTLHDENPEYKDFEKLKRFAIKYVKVNTGLDAQRGKAPLKLVEDAMRQIEDREERRHEPEAEDDRSRDAFEDADDELDIPGFEEKSIPDQLEIFAFMKAKGYQPAG